MRKKEDACNAWLQICENCESIEDYFAGGYSAIFKDVILYLSNVSNNQDRYSLALLSRDVKSITSLYNSLELTDYQKSMIKTLYERNDELLLTLNPYILDPKYNFLNKVLDELAVDSFIQDKLLSLNDYELAILKRIVQYCNEYGVNPNNIIAKIIDNIGYSSIPGRNNQVLLNQFENLFTMLQNYENSGGIIDKKMLGHIASILNTHIIFPKNIDEIVNYEALLKQSLKEKLETNDIGVLKSSLISIIFSLEDSVFRSSTSSLSEAKFFIKRYNVEGIHSEYYTSPGFIELFALKIIIETDDIDKIKEIAQLIIDDKDYEINSFNNLLMEENILLIYAKEFNKCKPKFDDSNLLSVIDGVSLYDSGTDFYAIVKSLGAFSDDGKSTKNYYDEWNNSRYRSHVNAVSLIRNDNLAFAEPDGKSHIKIGFLQFNEQMFLGAGNKDINSASNSRDMSTKIHSKLFFPSELINKTREWHNELDYERKDLDEKSSEFKKNPDFIVLDQEVEDIISLTADERKNWEELKSKSIQAAKDFGNIPILVINREKIAKNEISIINNMINEYANNHNIEFLKNAIVRFNNNRNGCRGPQHQYIREKYFSNEILKNKLFEIDRIIQEEHRNIIDNLLKSEYDLMCDCRYDKSTIDMPSSINDTRQIAR